jgi:hypothetical protein
VRAEKALDGTPLGLDPLAVARQSQAEFVVPVVGHEVGLPLVCREGHLEGLDDAGQRRVLADLRE